VEAQAASHRDNAILKGGIFFGNTREVENKDW